MPLNEAGIPFLEMSFYYFVEVQISRPHPLNCFSKWRCPPQNDKSQLILDCWWSRKHEYQFLRQCKIYSLLQELLPSLERAVWLAWSSASDSPTLILPCSVIHSEDAELLLFLPNFNSLLNPFDDDSFDSFSIVSAGFSISRSCESGRWALTVSGPSVLISRHAGGALQYSDFAVHGSSKEEIRAYGAWYCFSAEWVIILLGEASRL